LGDLKVGEVREYTERDFFEKLKIDNY